MKSGTKLFTEFEHELLTSENQLGTSMLLMLAWLATADGHVDNEERAQFNEIVKSSRTKISGDYLFRVASQRDTKALLLACEILADEMKGERSRLLVELSVGMAMADGHISQEELHIIRFLADLMGISAQGLDSIFVELTGFRCPDPIDLSRRSSWFSQSHESRQDQSRQSGQEKKSQGSAPGTSPREINALHTLGLEHGATKEQIKKSYRRMAQLHHPDRFLSLGDEAVAAATTRFQKINTAYEYLMSHA